MSYILSIMHQSGVCLPSFKKRLGPSLSCRFLEYAGNWKNLISWFRRLITKEHWLFTNNQNPGLVYCWMFKLQPNCILVIFYMKLFFYVVNFYLYSILCTLCCASFFFILPSHTSFVQTWYHGVVVNMCFVLHDSSWNMFFSWTSL